MIHDGTDENQEYSGVLL